MFWYFFWSSLSIIIIIGLWVEIVARHYQWEHRVKNSKCFEYLDNRLFKRLDEIEKKVDLIESHFPIKCGYREDKIKEIFKKSDGPLDFDVFKNL